MKIRTREEKLWRYLSDKLGNTATAKQIFHRMMKEFKARSKEVSITYSVDARPLKQSLKLAKSLNAELRKVKVSK